MRSAAGGCDYGISGAAIVRVSKKDTLAGRRIVVLAPIQNALVLYDLPKLATACRVLWIDR
jgi:hypothetical protein